MAHRVAFDVPLTFFVTMAILCFYKGYAARHNHSPTNPPISPPLQGKDEGEAKKDKNDDTTPSFISSWRWVCLQRAGRLYHSLLHCINLSHLEKRYSGLKGNSILDRRGDICLYRIYLGLSGKHLWRQGIYLPNAFQTERRTICQFICPQTPILLLLHKFSCQFYTVGIFIPEYCYIPVFQRRTCKDTTHLVACRMVCCRFHFFFDCVREKRHLRPSSLSAAPLITAWFLNEFVEQLREKHLKK